MSPGSATVQHYPARRTHAGVRPHLPRPPRVVVVCPVLANYDAIAASARDTYRVLSGQSGFEIEVLTLSNDFDDVPARIVSGLADLLLHPAFQAADIVIYHFGMYCDLFDALIATKGRALQFVRFHNVTPPQFVPAKHRELIERSFLQAHNIAFADEVWADSCVNAETLVSLGIDRDRIKVIPLAVERPAPSGLCGKTPNPLNLLFVGRFVQSKGIFDLVTAIDWVRSRCTVPFHLRIAGNMLWSDKTYVELVQNAIAARKLESSVEILGTVSSESMEALYHGSHVLLIPSYHEGFCKPVIEGLRAGCVPVGYASYNLPVICNGLGRMVPTGDTHALGLALGEVLEGIARSYSAPEKPLLPLDRGQISARAFDLAACEYVQDFAFNRLESATLERIHTHFSGL